MTDINARLIDRWFPVAAVDEACRTPAGSGLTEKAIFAWFASRPIAQARAAALTSLLPDDPALKPLVEAAIRRGDSDIMIKLAERVIAHNGGSPPTSSICSREGQSSPWRQPGRARSRSAWTCLR